MLLAAQPVEIVSVIRRLRGGSQAFLVRGKDRAHYVAKFGNNPQGNRTLINEFIASHLLSALGVATPDLAILRLDSSCQDRQNLYFSMDQDVPIASGLHLGSKCPVDPDKVAIFDFLPRTFYSRVANLDDVGLVFAFDQWVAHTAVRQFIFAREIRRRTNSQPLQASQFNQQNASFITAWAIDNGMCFGRDWTFSPKVLYAQHPFLDIYSHCDLEGSAGRGANLIQLLPASVLQAACQNIPEDWFAAGNAAQLKRMLTELQHRQQTIVSSIQDYVGALRQPRSLRVKS